MKLEKLILRNPVAFILVMLLLPLIVAFVAVETGVIAPGSDKLMGPYYYTKVGAIIAAMISFGLSIFLLYVAECCVTEEKAEVTEVFEVQPSTGATEVRETLRLANRVDPYQGEHHDAFHGSRGFNSFGLPRRNNLEIEGYRWSR